MATKAESDADLALNITAIEATQETVREATGLYASVNEVPSISPLVESLDMRITEYKGGGPKIPYIPDRNPGYLIIQRAVENGKEYYRITDKGDSSRSTYWFEEAEVTVPEEG